jgi:hypothetical protein
MKLNNSTIENNNPINKYNSQYLKCIVTKYKSSIKLLANSGSLIVLKPNDNIDRSYVYLGNTFLASGYGFENEELLNKATTIVKTYDDTIDGLRNEDTSIRTDLSNKYNHLLNELTKYVQKDAENPHDGDASNTYLFFNNGQTAVKLIDVINHGRNALYDDIEIKKITKTVITENNEFYVSDDLNAEGNYEQTVQSSVLNLPIGTIIKKIKIRIEYDPHDAGLIYKLVVGYAQQSTSDRPKNIYIVHDGNIPTQISEYTYETTFILDFADYPQLNQYVVKDKDINVISKLSAIVSGTPKNKYKYYPELESKFGIQILSTANAIQEYETRNLTSLTVHPLFYVKYHCDVESSMDQSYDNFNDHHGNLLTDERFINEFIDIPQLSKRITIAVPSVYKLINISYIPNSDSMEYTGNEEYNWSGSTSIKNGVNIVYRSLCITCDIYSIEVQSNTTDSNQLNSGKIKLSLVKVNDKTSNIIKTTSNKTSESDYISWPSKRMPNEIFDNIYWVNNDEEKLNEIYRNGLKI